MAAHAPNIPAAVFAMFQMMFAVIAPLLMTGAFAERTKFRAVILISVLWELLVYYPVAHWVWGGGWLDQMGVLDFAGGIVIHTTAGVGSLVLALQVGPRRGFETNHGEFPPSNILLATLGAAFLWVGWFGFNAGSALSAGKGAVSAFVATHIGACTSGLVWLLHSARTDRPKLTMMLNGAIAGLAGVTPAAGYIAAWAAAALGGVLGVATLFAASIIKPRWHIDDALDVSVVHGVPGIVGALFIGFAASVDFSPSGANGLFYGGGGHLLLVQAVAVVVVFLYAGLVTYAIGHVVGACVGGLRVSEEEEKLGLDISEHAELASEFIGSRSRADSLTHEVTLHVHDYEGDANLLGRPLLAAATDGGVHSQPHTRLPSGMPLA